MMTNLTLTLDNVDLGENTEQISRLFPKCRPRSDINLNPVITLEQDHNHVDNIILSVMNNEKSNDRWEGPCSEEKENFGPSHSTDEDDLIIETDYVGETYKLRDSRIIEIAGGREIYSQSRSKANRKARNIGVTDDNERRKLQKSPVRQGVWELRGRSNELAKLKTRPEVTEGSFTTDICSINVSEQDCKSLNVLDCNKTTTLHGDVVIFDDIDDDWENKKVIQNTPEVYKADQMQTEHVAKVLGSLPIAVYEESPRRYGPRQMDIGSHPQLPSAQSLLASPSVYPPRPGFPQRIISTPSDTELSSADDNHIPTSPCTTTTTAAFDYLYEFSETRKVLEEFFKCPPSDDENPLHSDFQDLDYELRLQSSNSGGNSYVAQRLAESHEEQCDFTIRIDSPKQSNSTKIPMPQDRDTIERENNFLDLSIGTGSSGDLGDTEVGLQVGHSRNFTLSPETTDCDSNCGDLDSEVSLMLLESELIPTIGIRGSSCDLAAVCDSSRLCSSMPVLEDGLSSGHASDTDNNNPTIVIISRRDSDIERDTLEKDMQGLVKPLENGLSPGKDCITRVVNANACGSYDDILSHVDSLVNKTPPPPAPVPHRIMTGEKADDVEAAIKDIRLTLQRTKTLPFTCSTEEDRGTNTDSPIWVPRQRGLSGESADSDRKVPNGEEAGDEEEADTDLETDRLLGQQRTDDPGFFDDKGWRKPKSRTILPSHTISTPKHILNLDEGTIPLILPEPPTSHPPSPVAESDKSQSPHSQKGSTSSLKLKRCETGMYFV